MYQHNHGCQYFSRRLLPSFLWCSCLYVCQDASRTAVKHSEVEQTIMLTLLIQNGMKIKWEYTIFGNYNNNWMMKWKVWMTCMTRKKKIGSIEWHSRESFKMHRWRMPWSLSMQLKTFSMIGTNSNSISETVLFVWNLSQTERIFSVFQHASIFSMKVAWENGLPQRHPKPNRDVLRAT